MLLTADLRLSGRAVQTRFLFRFSNIRIRYVQYGVLYISYSLCKKRRRFKNLPPSPIIVFRSPGLGVLILLRHKLTDFRCAHSIKKGERTGSIQSGRYSGINIYQTSTRVCFLSFRSHKSIRHVVQTSKID